jgi:hypothetical protein
MALRLPTALPHTQEMEEFIEREGASKDRYMLDYLLGMYAFVDRCTGEQIQHGSVSYYLHWKPPRQPIRRRQRRSRALRVSAASYTLGVLGAVCDVHTGAVRFLDGDAPPGGVRGVTVR